MVRSVILSCFIPFLCSFILLPDHSLAQELSPVSQKAKTMVEAVYEYINSRGQDPAYLQKALETSPDFRDDENRLYIFMHAYDLKKKLAVCIGQGIRPELVGKNMWHLRTPSGRHLFPEFIDLINHHGEGWIEYDWLNPYINKIQTKKSFIKGVTLKDGRTAWIGCGFWKPGKKEIKHPKF